MRTCRSARAGTGRSYRAPRRRGRGRRRFRERPVCACDAPFSAGGASVPPVGGFEELPWKAERCLSAVMMFSRFLRAFKYAQHEEDFARIARGQALLIHRHAHLHARRRLERCRRLLLCGGDADHVEHRRPQAHDRRSVAQDLHGASTSSSGSGSSRRSHGDSAYRSLSCGEDQEEKAAKAPRASADDGVATLSGMTRATAVSFRYYAYVARGYLR